MHAPREPAWAWLLAGLLAALALRAARPARPPPVPPAARARWAPEDDPARMAPRELRALPGLGERRATAAAEARWRHDPAGPPLLWTDVPGLGEATAERVEAWLAERGRAGALLSGEAREER